MNLSISTRMVPLMNSVVRGISAAGNHVGRTMEAMTSDGTTYHSEFMSSSSPSESFLSAFSTERAGPTTGAAAEPERWLCGRTDCDDVGVADRKGRKGRKGAVVPDSSRPMRLFVDGEASDLDVSMLLSL